MVIEHTQDILRRVALGGYIADKQLFAVGDWLGKALKSTSVSVGSTPVALPPTSLGGRRLVVIYNYSDFDIYLGDSTVTIENGLPLPASTPLCINLDEKLSIYGVAGATSCDVRVLEGS